MSVLLRLIDFTFIRRPRGWQASLVFVWLVLGRLTPWAAQSETVPGTLTNLAQLAALKHEIIGPVSYQVKARAVVVFVVPQGNRLYLQDGEATAYLDTTENFELSRVGELLEFEGQLREGWLMPSIRATRLQWLGPATLPQPREVDLNLLNRGSDQGRMIVARGKVRDMIIQGRSLVLLVLNRGIDFRVHAPLPSGVFPVEWLDAEVEVVGMNRAISDNFGNAFGFLVYQANTNMTRIITPGNPDLFGQQVIPISTAARLPGSTTHRVKIRGTVMVHSPGQLLYLQDSTGTMRVELLSLLPTNVLGGRYLTQRPQTLLQPGEIVEVIGAPLRGRFATPTLVEGEFRRVGVDPSPLAEAASARQLAAGELEGQLVSMRARLLDRKSWSDRRIHHELLVLESDGQVFQAQWRGESPFQWAGGESEYVQVTGVNEVELGEWQKFRSFTLLLRDGRDVLPAEPPQLWERAELRRPFAYAAGALLLMALLFEQQRRQIKRVRASEERFRALIENSFDVTLVIDSHGAVRYLSPSGYELLGIQKAAGRKGALSVWEFIHPEDLPRIRQAHQEILTEPRAIRKVNGYRLQAVNGEIIYADAVGTNCLHVPGVNGIVVNLRDVTDRKKAAVQLERAMQVQAKLNEFATSLSQMHAEDEIVWEITRKCISVLGFEDCVVYLLDEERQVLVQSAAYGPKNPRGQEILFPIEIRVGQGIVGTVAQSGTAEIIADTRLDSRYILDDCLRLSEISVPIMAEGKVLGVIDSEHSTLDYFTMEHLTILNSIASICANKLIRARAEQKLIELNAQLEKVVESRTAELRASNAQLLQSEEKFSKAFRSSPIILAIARLSDGCFIDVNQAFLEAFDMPREKVIGKTSFEINVWASEQERQAFVTELRRHGQIRHMQMVVMKHGKPRQLTLSADLIEIGHEPCIVSVSVDITEKQEAEKELHRALARERELSELKSRFVATISHEFRTPLGVILSSADILSRYWDRLADENRREHLADVQASALEMARQMENVLVFGRAEAHRLEYTPASVELPRLVGKIVEQLSAVQGRDGIRVRAQPGLGAMMADEALLTHILTNLLSNAMKYSPADAPIDCELGLEGDEAFLRVTDRGLGIPERDRQKLFNPFQRGSNVGRVRGTGMGLAIVKRCAELHQGEVLVHSQEGAGTVVTVRWPFVAAVETRFFAK